MEVNFLQRDVLLQTFLQRERRAKGRRLLNKMPWYTVQTYFHCLFSSHMDKI
jgi:hypothetical protein